MRRERLTQKRGKTTQGAEFLRRREAVQNPRGFAFDGSKMTCRVAREKAENVGAAQGRLSVGGGVQGFMMCSHCGKASSEEEGVWLV